MQIIRSCSNLPGFNLAAEECLFSQRQDEILFLYINRPCIVIGCNQAMSSEIDPDYCSEQSISLFRRMSGGGAVYHDEGNLNYCFIKNRVPGKFPLSSEFLQSIIQVLMELYIPVSIGKRNDIWLPGGYKISGTASHVGKFRELHHGTLLYDSNLEKLQKALSPKTSLTGLRAIASVPSPVKNIRAFLAEQNKITPSVSDFFQLFIKKLLEYFSLDSLSVLTESEILQIQKIETNIYESFKWTLKK